MEDSADQGQAKGGRPIADADRRGVVFNIQRYSVHDGAGIRTTVFLKGCPLRCDWCSNPESQRPGIELAVSESRCLGVEVCDYCAHACQHGALGLAEAGAPIVERARCLACLACAGACPAKALHPYGMERRVAQVLDAVEQDQLFYARSGGGMTLSGGEPLMQGDFALALLREARRRRLDCAIETCGQVPWERLEEAAGLVRQIYFDLKLADPNRHECHTGRSNGLILENFHRLAVLPDKARLHVRTPVVPGINDDPAEIGAILDLLQPYPAVRYELLPYHRLGEPKYHALGRTFPMGTAKLDAARFAELERLVRSRRGVTEEAG